MLLEHWLYRPNPAVEFLSDLDLGFCFVLFSFGFEFGFEFGLVWLGFFVVVVLGCFVWGFLFCMNHDILYF